MLCFNCTAPTLCVIVLLFSHTDGLLPRHSPPVARSSVLSVQLAIADVASLLPSSIAKSLLEDVSWKDTALYAGLPLLSLAYLSTRPPARLLSEQQLEQLVQDTNLQGRNLKVIYKASRDGWSATDFHACVDNVGSAIVAAKALGIGRVFGGYNPAGWRSTDDYVTSTAAFLWATGKRSGVQRFPILPGGNAAVFDYATSGPNFGAGDLQIGPSEAAVLGGFAGPDTEDTSTSAGNLRQVKSVAGVTYDVNADWPARGKLVLTEVEVYGVPL
jgi:hypothetical protein